MRSATPLFGDRTSEVIKAGLLGAIFAASAQAAAPADSAAASRTPRFGFGDVLA